MRDLLALAVSMGRGAAEDRMVDACVIRRRTGLETDSDTGVATVLFEQVYEGPCRVVDVESIVSTPEVAGATVTVRRVRIDIPAGAARPRGDDVAEVTVSLFAPEIVGATLRVTRVPIGTQATALRLGMEEVAA